MSEIRVFYSTGKNLDIFFGELSTVPHYDAAEDAERFLAEQRKEAESENDDPDYWDTVQIFKVTIEPVPRARIVDWKVGARVRHVSIWPYYLGTGTILKLHPRRATIQWDAAGKRVMLYRSLELVADSTSTADSRAAQYHCPKCGRIAVPLSDHTCPFNLPKEP